jgi:hypothetical protein
MRARFGSLGRASLATGIGVGLAFFVAASVYADGQWGERVATAGVLLLAYALAGMALGYHASGWFGLGLVLPGVAVLILVSTTGEAVWWYLPYGTLIAGCAAGGGALVARWPPRTREVARRGDDAPG